MSEPTLRCAVYTRKSSEEGLDMAFNSLDAQREAGIDYIKSQKHQGWTPITTAYDDGGYSGGSTDRPALQRLIEDISRGRVDVIVVYKVDRLSRSLADFARLMQLFDEHKVSFVSVTQQFNTTTSMGRLTLNMLLSFAQFEREVTGERIRDKIAATKRRGVWVCGQPPLGYRMPREGDSVFTAGDRTLRIVESEAAVIRAVFTGYLEHRSLLAVSQRLSAEGHTTRRWLSSRGLWHGGKPLRTQLVYRILNNPVYIGKIVHARGGKTEVYPGLHEPIIKQPLWDQVHSVMGTVGRTASVRWTHTHLLKGKVRTFDDHAMSPGSVLRKVKGGVSKRVRYYTSQKAIKQGYKNCQIKTINAGHLDDLVRAVVMEHVRSSHGFDLRQHDAQARDHQIRAMLHRVVLAPDRLAVTLDLEQVSAVKQACSAAGKHPEPGAATNHTTAVTIPTCLYKPEVEANEDQVTLALHIQLKRHDGRRMILAPDGRDLLLTMTPLQEPVPQEHLVRALGQAFVWHQRLVQRDGTIESIAREAGMTASRLKYLLPLTRLGPAVITAVFTGRLGPSISLMDLHAAAEHLDWSLQAAALMLTNP